MTAPDTNVESIYTRRFWTDTVERVIRTTAQVAATMFAVPAVGAEAGVDGALVGLSWQDKLTVIGVTALLTFLTCLAGRTTGDTSTASLTSGTPSTTVKTVEVRPAGEGGGRSA